MGTLTSSLVVRLIDRVSKPAQSATRNLLGIHKASGRLQNATFGDRLAGAVRRNDAALANARGGLIDAAAGFYALKTAIGAPVREAMMFESAMADVRKVVDFPTPKSFQEFRNGLIGLSTEVPIAVNGLAAIAAAAGQAGIAGDDLNKFTETAAKVGVAFDISANQAGESMAKLMTGLGLTIDEVTLLSDAMNHLSNSQASSAAEILEVVRRVGAQGKQYGFTATEVAAFGSAMIAAGAQSDVAATSFRNMGKALTMGDSATKRVRGGLKAVGLEASDVARRMQEDAVGTTVNVLERISKMPAEMQAALSTDIFGSEARALGPLLTNLDLVRKSLGLVSNESDYAGSSFKEFEVRASTFENAVQIFNNRLSAMKVVIGSALIPSINNLMDAVTPMIERFTEFAQAHPELVANVMAATASIVAFRVAAAGLRFVGLLGRGGALSMLSMGFNTIGRASMGARVAATNSVALQTALAGMEGKSLGTLSRIGAGFRGILRAVPGVGLAAPVFSALGAAIAAVAGVVAGITAPVWIGIAAGVAVVAAAGYKLWQSWDRIKATLSGVSRRLREELGPAFEAVGPVVRRIFPGLALVSRGFGLIRQKAGEFIGWFKTKWAEFKTWVGGFFQREVLGESEAAALEQRGYDMVDRVIGAFKSAFGAMREAGANLINRLWEGMKAKFAEFLEWVRQIPSRIVEAIGSIDLSSFIKWPSRPSWLGGGGGSEPVLDGARARGGPVRAGETHLVGEEGPEAVTFGANGMVHTASKTASMLRGLMSSSIGSAAGAGVDSSGPASITISVPAVHINGVQDIRGAASEIGSMLEEELSRAVRGMFSDGGF